MSTLVERHEDLINTIEQLSDLDVEQVEEIILTAEEAFLVAIEKDAIFPISAYTDAQTVGLEDVYSIKYTTGSGIARHLAQEGDDIVFLTADKSFITVEPLRPAGAEKFDTDYRLGKSKASNAVQKISTANSKAWVQNQLINFDEFPTQRGTVTIKAETDGRKVYESIKTAIDTFMNQVDKTPDQILLGRDTISLLTDKYFNEQTDVTVFEKLQSTYSTLEFVEKRGLNGKGFFIIHDTASGNTSSLERSFATKAISVSNGIAEGIAGRHAAIGVVLPVPNDVLVVEIK